MVPIAPLGSRGVSSELVFLESDLGRSAEIGYGTLLVLEDLAKFSNLTGANCFKRLSAIQLTHLS